MLPIRNPPSARISVAGNEAELIRRSRRPVAFPYTTWNCGWRRERRVRRVMRGRKLKPRRCRGHHRGQARRPRAGQKCLLSGPECHPLRPFRSPALSCPGGPPRPTDCACGVRSRGRVFDAPCACSFGAACKGSSGAGERRVRDRRRSFRGLLYKQLLNEHYRP